jgi:dipeptidyl aminopeptidase/acylaminoacyl peptidase
MPKTPIRADDLYRFQTVSGAEISPDGARIAFTVGRVDRATEKKHSNVWVAPTDSTAPHQFTYGDQRDTSPQWSPDGSKIAFLSNRGDEHQPQIHVIRVDGGEARPLTKLKGDIGAFRWSPDAKRLVCVFRKQDAEVAARDADDRKKQLGVVARHITRVHFKYDGAGMLPHERAHLWTIDARTGRAKQLTEGDEFSESSPEWSPDGRHIVFVSNRSDDPEFTPEAVGLYVIPADGGDMREIATPIGSVALPAYSPDGRWIAYFGSEGRGDWWKNTRLYIVPADGAAAPTCLTAHTDLHLGDVTLGDLAGFPGANPPPRWTPDGSTLYVVGSRHGSTKLCAVSVEDGSLRDLSADEGVHEGISLSSDAAMCAYIGPAMDSLGQVGVLNLTSGRKRRLTRFNDALLRSRDLGAVEELWFRGPDGADLQGWIMAPPDFDGSRQYPSILEIHGGPLAQYGHRFMHEFRFLAAQGYVVYFCNPRGGQGYGEEHAKAIWNDWGGPDYADLMAWADLIATRPYIDSERMGVTGGSYGGFMTAWIIGHTHRFKAAVVQRPVTNFVSMWGSSDMNWVFQQIFGDVPPWEGIDNYWRQSPMKYIGAAKTPTLVIHSEQDLRCAIEQGEQLFVALKSLGVDTEMVRFPDEPHGLSRGGRTDRRIERLNHIVRWFDRYLKTEQSAT